MMIYFSFVGYPFTYFMSENPNLMRWRLVSAMDPCDRNNSLPYFKVPFPVVSSASPLEVWWMWTPLSPKCSRPHSSTMVSPAESVRQQRLWTSKTMRTILRSPPPTSTEFACRRRFHFCLTGVNVVGANCTPPDSCVLSLGARPICVSSRPTVTRPCTSSWWKPSAPSIRSTSSRYGT